MIHKHERKLPNYQILSSYTTSNIQFKAKQQTYDINRKHISHVKGGLHERSKCQCLYSIIHKQKLDEKNESI